MIAGYQNEINFINYLNKKKYKQVNILFQEMLKQLYPEIKLEDTIKAYKYGKYAKVDIVINVNGVEKGISVKCGINNSVHLEPIDRFVLYLENLGFSNKDKLLRYLYSDGTNNNTGNIRQSSAEYKEENEKDIIEINNELRKIEFYLINRFLIKTEVNYRVTVDMFIVGYVDDFLWALKEEVLEYLIKIEQNSSGVHVSNLFIQNWNKNLKYNPKYEHCRGYIQVKWYSILEDIMMIIIFRNNNNIEISG